MIKMNISDKWYFNFFLNNIQWNRIGCPFIWTGTRTIWHPASVNRWISSTVAFHIVGFGHRHTLDHDLVITTDLDVAHLYRPCFLSMKHDRFVPLSYGTFLLSFVRKNTPFHKQKKQGPKKPFWRYCITFLL